MLRHEPSGWQAPLPGQPRSWQLRHCHWPVLQMGAGVLQSELVAQPTHAPKRQILPGADAQSVPERQATQVPVLSQCDVAPEQVAQVPPTGPQCAASTG